MTISVPRERSWFRTTMSTPGGIIGGTIVVLLIVIAIVAPILWTDQASTIDASQARLTPSFQHPFGTDELGRDILLRVLVGTRLTLLLSFGAVAIATVGGVLVGVLASVAGERARQVMYQLTATATAFPAIMLALLLATLLGRSGAATMIGLGIAGIPSVARLTMNLAVSAAGAEYVSVARVVGVRGPRVLARYILPNVLEPLATLTVMSTASYLLVISSLSFLGLGVQPPEWDWGQMISSAMATIYQDPTTIVGPGLAIVLAGVSFNLLGEALASGIDPRSRAALGRRRGRQRTSSSAIDPTAPTRRVLEPKRQARVDDAVLEIEDLLITVERNGDELELVRGVSVAVRKGERLGIVGESGSGKSLTLMSLAALKMPGLNIRASRHCIDGEDISALTSASRRTLLGSRVSMIFQDPMSSLSPTLRIGSQLDDKLRAHSSMGRKGRRAAIVAALADVGLPDPESLRHRHVHQLSGGQRQRVMIAMALLGDTEVVLADEPTTALDVSVQAQIVELLDRVNRTRGAAIVLVSHDLPLVSQVCDRILVMYQGEIVEEGTTEQILTDPQHPYTRRLLEAITDPTAADVDDRPEGVEVDWHEPEQQEAIVGTPEELVALSEGGTRWKV